MNVTYRVPESNQLTHDDIRIGVGNIWRDPSPVDGDPARTPLGAGLWIFVRDHPEHDRRLRVRSGDRLQIMDHIVTVTHIDGESVTLAFISPDAQPTNTLEVTA